jgi:4-amino-4-deoxy-L-arabinose transferase-like glycosyltransferase
MPFVMQINEWSASILQRPRQAAIVLAGIGFAVRLGLAIYFGLNEAPVPGSDQHEHDIYSWNLAQGRGFRGPSADVADPDHLTAWRVPGSSFVWAGLYNVFGHRYDVIRIANCFAGALAVWLTYEIGRQCFNPFVGLVAAAIYAVFPTALIFAIDLLSEPLGTLWFLASIWMCLLWAERPTWPRAVVAGLLLGFTILTRPSTGLMLPMVTVWALWQMLGQWRTMAQACVIPLMTVLVFVPWIIRNYIVFDAFVPIATSGGAGLLQGNNDVVVTDPRYFGYSYWDTSIPEYREALQTAGNEVERDRRARSLAIQWLRDNPDKWWFLIRAKFWRSLTPFLQSHSPQLYKIGMLLGWGPILVLFALAFFPTLWRFLRNGEPGWIIHVGILHYIFGSIIFFGFARYRQPVEPLCIILAVTVIDFAVGLFCKTRESCTIDSSDRARMRFAS